MLLEYSNKEAIAYINSIFKDVETGGPMVNLTWYYRPADLFTEEHDFFGQAELFTSDHIQDIGVHCIYAKVKVIPFEEYWEAWEVSSDTYYYRAHYEHATGSIKPDLTDWKRGCV